MINFGDSEVMPSLNVAEAQKERYRVLVSDAVENSNGAEMPAILRNRPNEQTREISLEAHRMWASFARNGVPSEDWPVCEEEDRAFMTIGEAGFKTSRESLPKIIRGFEGKYLL